MTDKRYLPNKSVFHRYDHRVRFNLIKGYHRKLTDQYQWYVLPWESPSYYCNGSLSEIIAESLKYVPSVKIFNCNWVADRWDEAAYSYEAHAKGIREEWRSWKSEIANSGYSHDLIGVKFNGEWKTKYLSDKKSFYFGSRNEQFYAMAYNGIYANWYDKTGVFEVGTFMDKKPSKTPPSNVVESVLREMMRIKWRGFYDSEVDYICEVTGTRKEGI